MVKCLRGRQILEENDFSSENHSNSYPIKAKLTKNALKKFICKRFEKRGKKHHQKQINFDRNVEKGCLNSIIDQTSFECSICLELMVRPTLMNCGHMFCLRCLESNIAHSQSCCLCRQQQSPEDFIRSTFAEKLIEEIVVPRSNEIIKYLCRTSDCFEWIKRREIRDLTPGMIIDFQDAFKVWRRAIILKIFTDKNQKRVVDVKTFFKGTEIVETVEINSKRLAPLNFFTKAKYLEEFAPTLPEYHFHEKELEELQYRNTSNSQELFNFNREQEQNPLELPHLQSQHQQIGSGLEDSALALFNWQMNRSEFPF